MLSDDTLYFGGCKTAGHTISEYLAKPSDLLPGLIADVASGKILVFRGIADQRYCATLIGYFNLLLTSGFEKFVPITQGCDNYIRFSHDDQRAEVPLFCDSVSFFPWNRDRFDLFSEFADVYRLKNLVSGADPERYLDGKVSRQTTARIAAHFYPSGRGHLGTHIDPLGSHQEITCTLLLRKPAAASGSGYYVLDEKRDKKFIEDGMDVGDFYIGSPAIPHGVEKISGEYDPASSEGRWALLFPVNKTAQNLTIGDSKNV